MKLFGFDMKQTFPQTEAWNLEFLEPESFSGWSLDAAEVPI